MKLLSEEFLSKYRGQTPKNAGVLFYPVYLRTYSRWLPDLNRRERWDETVERVVEYSMSLYQGPSEFEALIEEAKELYDHIFNLKVMPAGRTLWVGGTEAAKKTAENQFNCSYRTIDDLEAFTDLFHLLLSGCGVGFRVLPEDVVTLPNFFPISLKNMKYIPANPELRRDETELYEFSHHEPDHVISIGDSREGWVEALRLFLEIATNPYYHREGLTTGVIIEYDFVRPKGERIKTGGGHAPGPEGLMDMFTSLAKVINNCGGRLSPVDCMDICNLIGKNVIVGGTRRSSQIALGSPYDSTFVDAKKDLWKNKENLHRAMSNNTVVFEERPSFEKIQEIFQGIRNNGEPGFFNIGNARRRRPNMQGINPCAEILMDSRGFCNLATVNWKAFVDRGYLNIYGLERAIRIATRVTTRMTNVTVSLPKWDYVQKRDRLLGVSMTGVLDALDAIGLEDDSYEAILVYQTLAEAALDESQMYADEMGIPRPLLVTTIKPEGTLSQLPTVSSGLHRAYAPYYIRRIRMSDMDPTCKALQRLGVPNEPDEGKKERIVFSFPIKTDAKMAAADEPAIDQFKRYLLLMDKYVDHNASCTLTIGEDEWEEIEKAVYDNFDNMVACAFLPKYTDAYPQMPYEEITKEQYEEMIAAFPDLTPLPDLVNMYEIGEFEDELEDECKGAACPVR